MVEAIRSSNASSLDVSLDIEVCRLEYSTSSKKYRLFLSIEVEGKTQKTTTSKTGAWNEKLKFVGKEDSTIHSVVFRKRRLGKNDILGSSTVELNSLARDELVILPLDQSSGPPITLQLKVSVLTLIDIPNAVAEINLNEVGDTLERIVGRLEILVSISTSLSELNPVAKMAVSLFRNMHSAVRAQISRDEKVAKLMEAMLEACAFLDDTKDAEDRIKESDGQRKLVCKLMTDIIECCHFVHAYAEKKFVSRLVSNLRTDLQSKISKHSDNFQEFRSRWSIRAITHTQISARRILGITEKRLSLALLMELPYCAGAHYEARAEASPLSPTCNLVTLAINEWANSIDNDESRIFVLYGDDPSRMSAIAQNVAQTFDSFGHLASSFFFRKGNKYRKPRLLFPTIARDLADRDAGFQKALEGEISRSMRLRRSILLSLSEQLTLLFLNPLVQSSPTDPVLIVIDACDPEMIRFLLERSKELPRNVRVFVTSRPKSGLPLPSEVVAGVTVHWLKEEPVNLEHRNWQAKWKADCVPASVGGAFFFSSPAWISAASSVIIIIRY